MLNAALRRGAARLRPAGRALSTKPAKKAPPHPYESFLSGGSSNYVEEMYAAWRQDPEAVHRSWQVYFREAEAGAPNPFVPPPALQSGATLPAAGASTLAPVPQAPFSDVSETMKVVQLVRAFQHRGHNIANLDPLGVYDADLDGSIPTELDLANYGWTDADMEREYDIGAFMANGFMSSGRPKLKLGKLIERLQQTYAGSIGVEYMHLADREQLNWIRERIETPEPHAFPKEEKLRMLDRLTCGAGGRGRPRHPRRPPACTRRRAPSSPPTSPTTHSHRAGGATTSSRFWPTSFRRSSALAWRAASLSSRA